MRGQKGLLTSTGVITIRITAPRILALLPTIPPPLQPKEHRQPRQPGPHTKEASHPAALLRSVNPVWSHSAVPRASASTAAMTRAPLFNVCLFASAATSWAESEQREKAVEEAFEAEEGADEEEQYDACNDTDDDARNGAAAEAVVCGGGGHACGAACGGGRAEGDGCGGGTRGGNGLDSVTCGPYEGGGGVRYRGEVVAAGVGYGVGCCSTLALVETDLATGAADSTAGGFLEVGAAGESCDRRRCECGWCGYHLGSYGGEAGAVG